MRFLSGIVIGLLCVNTFAFELYFGGVDGAGGQSVKCVDEQDSSKITYELWDFKESSILYDIHTAQKFNDMSVKDIVINRVQHFAEIIDENISQHESNVTELMTHLRFIKGADLKPIDDDASVILPENCEVQQLANYHSKKNIFVSEEIYEKLDNVNKAGLVLHEYIYALERSRGATTSTRTRRIVAYLFGQEEELEKVTFLTEADLKVAQFCSTDLLVSQQSRIDFYAVPQPDGSTRLDFIRLGNQLQYSKTSTVIPGEFPSEFNDDRYSLNSNFDNGSEIRLSSGNEKFYISADTSLPPYLQTKTKEYKCTSAEGFRTKGIVISKERDGRPLKSLNWKANIGDRVEQSVWVKNKYHKPVKHIQLDSDYLQVKVKQNKCPEILKPHRSCEVVLQFKASKPATQFEADLQINYLVKRKIKRKTVLMKFDVSENPVVPAVLSISNGPIFDFGTIGRGSAVAVTFTVTNSSGNEDAVNLKSNSLNAPFSFFGGGVYPGIGGTCSSSLASGSSCDLVVEFSPTANGVFINKLIIEYFNGSEFVETIREVRGAATDQANLVISGADPYDFGAVTVGARGEALFTVTNNGGVSAVDLVDSSIFSGSFNYKGGIFPGIGGSCNSSLAPGLSCIINVTFNPDQAGLHVDTIQLSYNDGVNTATASRDIAGIGLDVAVVTISGPGFDFGSVVVGASSAHTFTLTNMAGGSTAINLNEVGLAAPFRYTGGSFPGISIGGGGSGIACASILAAGQSCDINIEYIPVSSGVVSGAIELQYFNGNATVTTVRSLTGTGVNPGFLTISDGPVYDYGVHAIGSLSKHTFTLTNLGGSTLTNISDAGVLGGSFQYVGGSFPGSNGTCLATLSPLSSCTVVVGFIPTGTFTSNSTISINYNDGVGGSSSSRAIQGTGANPAALKFELQNKKKLDFGILLSGKEVSQIVRVVNIGGVAATGLTGSGLLGRPFLFKNGYPGLGAGVPCGTTLAPGATCDIAITFAPLKEGRFTDTLNLNYNNGVGAATSLLSLTGISFNPEKITLNLIDPFTSGVHSDSTPTFNVGKLIEGINVELYIGATCTSAVASGVAFGENIHLTSYVLSDGFYNFVTQTTDDYGNTFCADTIFVSYNLDTTAPLSPQNVQVAPWSTNKRSTPVISWEKPSAASDARSYVVRLYNDVVPPFTSKEVSARGPLSTTLKMRSHFVSECTPYTVGVTAKDQAGNLSSEITQTFRVDTTAPSMPQNLRAENVDALNSSARFSWDRASDNCTVGSYQISFARDEDRDGQLDIHEEENLREWFDVGYVDSYQDQTLSLDKSYAYFMQIRTVDAAGLLSAPVTVSWFVEGGSGSPQQPKLIGNWETGMTHSRFRNFIGTELMYLNVSYETKDYAQLNKVRYGNSELDFVGTSSALASNGFRTTTEVWVCDNACLYKAQNNKLRYSWSGEEPRESNVFSSHALFKNINQAEPINDFVQASNLTTTHLTVSGLKESQFSMSLMSCMHGSITDINWTDGSWVAQIPQTGGGSASTSRSAVRYPDDLGVHTATVMSSHNYRFVCAAVNLNTSWSYN